jgi:hypothetical protein
VLALASVPDSQENVRLLIPARWVSVGPVEFVTSVVDTRRGLAQACGRATNPKDGRGAPYRAREVRRVDWANHRGKPVGASGRTPWHKTDAAGVFAHGPHEASDEYSGAREPLASRHGRATTIPTASTELRSSLEIHAQQNRWRSTSDHEFTHLLRGPARCRGGAGSQLPGTRTDG